MNISRHNYETFFLLYVDNELSASERKMVELFVLENPDLRIEFESIQETKISGESVEFNIKNTLYRNAKNIISEEELLLHLDGETGMVPAGDMKAALHKNPVLKKQWELLQQTKLDAGEKFVFHGKKELYRHEKGRVIGFPYWRAVAAAVLLVISLYAGVSFLKNRNKIEEGTALTVPGKRGSETYVGSAGSYLQAVAGKTRRMESVTISNNEKDVEETGNKKQKNKKDDPVFFNHTKEQQDNLVHQRITIPAPALENINNPGGNKQPTLNVTNKSTELAIKNNKVNEVATLNKTDKVVAPSSPLADYNSIPPMPDSYAKTAVMNEGTPENDNKILYMSEERITRSKIGGLFRKVKRVIERNTNIKTGNGVTIAGFEIAVK